MKSVALLTGLLAALGQTQSTPDFDWTTLTPSTSLSYTNCYDEFKCAKLSVPLDWLSKSTTNSSSRVTLAIIALPATVAETDPSFGGTIITNPGGPGGSGVQFLLEAGKILQGVADGDKHYEILSFDPRGVGFTEPKADCFNNELSRDINTIQMRAIGALDDGLDIVRRQTSLFGSVGKLCADGPDIHGFMSTASVARDMVEIVDKLDELRNANGTAGTALRARGGIHARQEKDVARIQYWGFSYGTVLGNYFASMFPERIGRVILEAVVDVHDYTEGKWSKNLQDTDKDLGTFYSTCFAANTSCALYKEGDKSAKDIQSRVDNLLSALDRSPAQYVSGSSAEEITKADALVQLFSALYQPQETFPSVAGIIAEAMAGNFSTLYALLGTPTASQFCPSTVPKTYTWTLDAEIAVACGDAPSQNNMTEKQFLTYLTEQKSLSPYFAANWVRVRLACKAWLTRPKYRFTGPFTTPKFVSPPVAGKPAAPLLFISSEFDPVTPRANAVAMSKDHPESSVLTQLNPGHGTITTPGACRDAWIKKYFATGEVPPQDTMCEPDCTPFQPCPQGPVVKRSLIPRVPGVAGFERSKKGPLSLDP
ncbi:TAP-like protein-domain-containing protein [Hypomontagnella monticulosa]|nr:TAP-like protein-domain-containing protein [Hypomontagnella monticulosa]